MRQSTIPLRSLVPVIPLLLFFLATSFYGLDFGTHRDENRSKFDSVKNSLDSGVFMQAIPDPDRKDLTYYTYGGVNYLLTWAGFTPQILRFLHSSPWTRQALSAAISPLLYSVSSHVRVRGIYVVLCSLSIVWLYCLNIVLGRSRWEALLAAAILAGSWEFAYHSRWIAPAVLMMQFVLLSFLAPAIGRATKKTGWFYFAAVAVGLAAGTKYPAGLSIFFIVPGALQILWQKQRSAIDVLKHSIGLAFAYIGYFSQQSELVVRNVLIAVPVLCVAAARGIMVLAERLGRRPQIVLAAVAGIVLAINFGWEAYAATQIGKRNDSAYFLRKFDSYATSHPAETIFISQKLSHALQTLPDPVPPNLVTDPARHYTMTAFFRTEGPDLLWDTWPANWWGMYAKNFGALEVNLDAYPTFIRNQRILVTTTNHFERLPIKTADMLAP